MTNDASMAVEHGARTHTPIQGFDCSKLLNHESHNLEADLIGLLDLKSTDCRWPLNGRCDHGLVMYCGEPCAHRNSSYCQHHQSIAYTGYVRRVPKPKPAETTGLHPVGAIAA
jgi:hypothetical protein